MDSSGNILSAAVVEQLTEAERKARKLVPIESAQKDEVQGMNRKQRRAWHRMQRRAARTKS